MLPPRRPLNIRTPLKLHNNPAIAILTPMLPPRSAHKLPHTPAVGGVAINKALVTPMSVEGPTGRASIARLRSQNAGQVAAKARLFNAFVTDTCEPIVATTAVQTVAPLAVPQHSQPSHSQQPRQSAVFMPNNARQMNNHVHKLKTGVPSTTASGTTTGAAAASPRKSATPSGGRRSAAKNHLNGIHRRQKLRLAKSPIKRASPMRLAHLLDAMAADTVQSSPGRRQPRTKSKANFRSAMDSIVNDTESPRRRATAASGTSNIGTGIHTPVKLLRHSPRLQTRGGAGGSGF